MKLIPLIIAVIAIPAAQTFAADGKALYVEHCTRCHGEDGKGDTKMGKKLGAKDYSDAKVQDAVKDEDITKAIKEGFKDKEGKQLMKPTEGLTDEDVKALVAQLRSFKK